MGEWWNGRHSGLKIHSPLKGVRVRIPFPPPYLLYNDNSSRYVEQLGKTGRLWCKSI